MSNKLAILIVLGAIPFVGNAQALTLALKDKQGTSRGADRWNGNQVRYNGSIENTSGSAQFITGFQFTQDSGDWTDISVSASSPLNSLIGTQIADGANFNPFFLDGLMSFALSNESGLAYGSRTGTMNILGGATATSTDIIGTDTFDFQIYEQYGGVTSVLSSPIQSVQQGQSALYNWTVTAGTLPIWSWIALLGGSNTSPTSTLDFVNWPAISIPGEVLAAGQSWNGDAIRWNAFNGPTLAEVGSITGNVSAFGGRYVGDQDFMTRNPYEFNVTPVPEPMSMSVIAIGLAAMAQKRRKAS